MIIPDIGYRRTSAGAIVSTDDRQYLEILRRREEKKQHEALNNQIQTLQDELFELKELLLKAINK